MSGHEHGHHDHHDHHHADTHDHGSLKSYAIGFILSVILTAIPFWLVMHKSIDSTRATAVVLLAFAAVQVLVHMIYFLHMNGKAEGGWSMLALLFTGVVLVIMMSGSIWVMYHLNTNMMPGMPDGAAHQMSNMP